MNDEPGLTRCPNCLRLSLPNNGRCVFDDCVTSKRSMVEDRAKFLFTCHGYRLFVHMIYATIHDEPEIGWEGIPVARFDGSYTDAYRLLMAHQFPTDSNIQCVECHDADVAELGDMCDGCSRETSNWIKAGEFV